MSLALRHKLLPCDPTFVGDINEGRVECQSTASFSWHAFITFMSFKTLSFPLFIVIIWHSFHLCSWQCSDLWPNHAWSLPYACMSNSTTFFWSYVQLGQLVLMKMNAEQTISQTKNIKKELLQHLQLATVKIGQLDNIKVLNFCSGFFCFINYFSLFTFEFQVSSLWVTTLRVQKRWSTD